MKCPVDGETLVMTERSGVEIDYCPKCRGVWLDRGELDKILERSAAAAPAAAAAPIVQPEPARDYYQEAPRAADNRYAEPRRAEQRDRYRDHDDDDDDRRHGKRRGKRESFLSDLFDF